MTSNPIIEGLAMLPGLVYVYLMDGPSGSVLIDKGFAGDTPKILAGIAALGKRPEDIRHILLTHAHPDHIGELCGNLGDGSLRKAAYRGRCPSLPEPLRREQYAIDENSNIIRLRQPDAIDDPLTEVLRAGARQLLARAVELEVEASLAERADLKLSDDVVCLVRHGHGPEREVQTGIGAVAVSRPKVRDRGAAEGGERIRFT